MKVLILKENTINHSLFDFLTKQFNVLHVQTNQEALQLIQHDAEIKVLIIASNQPDDAQLSFLHEIENHQRNDSLGIILLAKKTLIHDKVFKNHITCFNDSLDTIDHEKLNHHLSFHYQLLQYKHGFVNHSPKENKLYKTIFQHIPIGVSIGYFYKPFYNWEDSFIAINSAFEKITGRSKKELINLGWKAITHPDDIDKNDALYQQFYRGEISEFSLIKRYIKPNNDIVWVKLHVTPLEFTPSASTYVCLVEDITYEEQVAAALEESERTQSVFLANLPGMAYRCLVDPSWTMQFVSDGCYDLTGYPPESFINNKEQSFNDITVSSYRTSLWQSWQQQIHNHQQIKSEYEIITASGQRKWVSEIGQPIYNEHDEPIAIEGIITDISESKQHLLQLQYMSEHNMLTGLYNRLYLESVLTKEHTNQNKQHALLLLNFKKINIVRLAYGYSFGERIIQSISEALSNLVDDDHQLFYVSFERLAFYVSNYPNEQALFEFCDTILSDLKKLELMRTIGCNIGIFEIHKYEARADMIVRNASIAAEIKDNHSMFGWRMYDEGLNKKLIRESEIKEELIQEVIKPKRLSCHFQPIINPKNNTIYSFEALARFNSENLGSISPSEFIPIAEETQLIIPLGKRILEMACDFIVSVKAMGFNDIKVSVNISTVQLLSNHFVNEVIEVLKLKQVDPSWLDLEITESVFASNFDYINRVLEQLRHLKIKISIDDFGTGYSSLARERELNVNILKVDKFFIDKLMFLKKDEAITGDIISMAHKLGHVVIAEGVEHKKQYDYLIEHGCDLIQGYYCSKPMDFQSALLHLKQKTMPN